jgi:hypothetical protein
VEANTRITMRYCCSNPPSLPFHSSLARSTTYTLILHPLLNLLPHQSAQLIGSINTHPTTLYIPSQCSTLQQNKLSLFSFTPSCMGFRVIDSDHAFYSYIPAMATTTKKALCIRNTLHPAYFEQPVLYFQSLHIQSSFLSLFADSDHSSSSHMAEGE